MAILEVISLTHSFGDKVCIKTQSLNCSKANIWAKFAYKSWVL